MEPEVSITTRFFDFLAWLRANHKKVLLWTVILAVVGAGLAALIYNRSQREGRASEALSEVRTPPGTTQPQPRQAEAYLKVAQEYSGTKAAARAILEAGGTYYTLGQYAEAQKQFDRVLREYPESQWRAEATLGVAATSEALGKTNEALAKYEEVRKMPTAAVADEAKLNVARLYEQQGRRVEAVKMFDELVKAYPYSGLGAEAGMRMEELTNRYPALATNLAPVMPPPTAMTMSNLQAQARSNVIRMTNMLSRTNLPPALKQLPAAGTTNLAK